MDLLEQAWQPWGNPLDHVLKASSITVLDRHAIETKRRDFQWKLQQDPSQSRALWIQAHEWIRARFGSSASTDDKAPVPLPLRYGHSPRTHALTQFRRHTPVPPPQEFLGPFLKQHKTRAKDENFTSFSGGCFRIPSSSWLHLLDLARQTRSQFPSTMNLLCHREMNHFMVDFEISVPLDFSQWHEARTWTQLFQESQHAQAMAELLETQTPMLPAQIRLLIQEYVSDFGKVSPTWIHPLRPLSSGQVQEQGPPPTSTLGLKSESVFSIWSRAIAFLVPEYTNPDFAVLKSASSWIAEFHGQVIAPCLHQTFVPSEWASSGQAQVRAKNSFHVHWHGLLMSPWEAYVLGLCLGEALERKCVLPPGAQIHKVVDQSVYGNGNRCLYSDRLAESTVCGEHFRHPPASIQIRRECKSCQMACQNSRFKGKHPLGRRFELYAVTRPGTHGEPYAHFYWEDAARRTICQPTEAEEQNPRLYHLSAHRVAARFPQSTAETCAFLERKISQLDANHPIHAWFKNLRYWQSIYYQRVTRPVSLLADAVSDSDPTDQMRMECRPLLDRIQLVLGVGVMGTKTRGGSSPGGGHPQRSILVPAPVVSRPVVRVPKVWTTFRLFPLSWSQWIWNRDWQTMVEKNQYVYRSARITARQIPVSMGEHPHVRETLDAIIEWCKPYIGSALACQSIHLYFTETALPVFQMTFLQAQEKYALCLARKKDPTAKAPRHTHNRSYVQLTPNSIVIRDLSDECKHKRKRESSINEKIDPNLFQLLFVGLESLEEDIQKAKGDMNLLRDALREEVESSIRPMHF